MELIDRDHHEWNKEFLEKLFLPEEVNAILKIPISTQRNDVIVWRDTPNGLFTVKNTYHGAMRRTTQLQTESSSTAGRKELWSRLWRLKIPNAGKKISMAGVS